jgi:hypothetical protein
MVKVAIILKIMVTNSVKPINGPMELLFPKPMTSKKKDDPSKEYVYGNT